MSTANEIRKKKRSEQKKVLKECALTVQRLRATYWHFYEELSRFPWDSSLKLEYGDSDALLGHMQEVAFQFETKRGILIDFQILVPELDGSKSGIS